ncbi:2OG-Fe(II) oxygenase family protein [Glacieibacterium sp.]|uniref:2OG-Fe(II) oxygenase family protein n=1 Tax=Glacieibacterium sp. TaxID=2860237 RepID=UPI003AFF8BB4
MLTITRDDVVAAPFPHVIKQDILPPDLFAALAADFPRAEIFETQRGSNGSVGSRTGSGFDIYRGDPSFETLTARSPAWAEFADFLNSERFIDTFRDVFADHLDDIGLRIDVRRSHIDPAYVEPRDQLTETASPVDKAFTLANKVLGPLRSAKPIELFTRLDIHKSMGGYRKPPHCDRPNRLCSLIVYFTDAEAIGMEGGELLIFQHKQPKPVTSYERHPKEADVQQVAKLTPKANLGVFFPCQNNSYHGVTPVLSKGLARDFLYINISGRSRSLW